MAERPKKKKSGAQNRKRRNEMAAENDKMSKRMFQFLHPSTSNSTMPQSEWDSARPHSRNSLEKQYISSGARPNNVICQGKVRTKQGNFWCYFLFFSKKFPAIVDSIDNSEELGTKISAFCENYNFDVGDCAAELISFAATFGKFEKSDDEVRENNEEEDEDQGKQSVGDGEKLKEIRSKLSYHRALEILANPSYHLVDAYPLLYNAYGKILAIPMTSCTPERTFSLVKQVKTRLRSIMEQDRLESLILMATEREIASHLDIDKIIDIFGASSPELSRLLIKWNEQEQVWLSLDDFSFCLLDIYHFCLWILIHSKFRFGKIDYWSFFKCCLNLRHIPFRSFPQGSQNQKWCFLK